DQRSVAVALPAIDEVDGAPIDCTPEGEPMWPTPATGAAGPSCGGTDQIARARRRDSVQWRAQGPKTSAARRAAGRGGIRTIEGSQCVASGPTRSSGVLEVAPV